MSEQALRCSLFPFAVTDVSALEALGIAPVLGFTAQVWVEVIFQPLHSLLCLCFTVPSLKAAADVWINHRAWPRCAHISADGDKDTLWEIKWQQEEKRGPPPM